MGYLPQITCFVVKQKSCCDLRLPPNKVQHLMGTVSPPGLGLRGLHSKEEEENVSSEIGESFFF